MIGSGHVPVPRRWDRQRMPPLWEGTDQGLLVDAAGADRREAPRE